MFCNISGTQQLRLFNIYFFLGAAFFAGFLAAFFAAGFLAAFFAGFLAAFFAAGFLAAFLGFFAFGFLGFLAFLTFLGFSTLPSLYLPAPFPAALAFTSVPLARALLSERRSWTAAFLASTL